MKPNKSAIRRTLLTAAFVMGLLAVSIGQPVAAQPIYVQVNGEAVRFGATGPTRMGGRVVVPMRAIFEALGASVQWDTATQSINAQRGATTVEMGIGRRTANINGQQVTLDQPPILYQGSTMVPLRFVGEALGTQVQWVAEQNTVFITDPVTPPTTPGTTVGTVPGTNPGTNAGTTGPSFTTPPNPVGITPPVVTLPTTQPTGPGYTTPAAASAIVGTVVKVDPNPPATITVRVGVDTEARLRTYNLADNALLYRQATGALTSDTPTYGPARAITLNQLVAGEQVRLLLNEQNEVRQVVSEISHLTARVRFAQGNQIVLDDEQNTTLTIGSNLRFVDPKGKTATSADVAPGSNVALYISPSTRAIYQISANNPDIVAAGGTANPTPVTQPATAPPTTAPPTTTPPAGTGQIQATFTNPAEGAVINTLTSLRATAQAAGGGPLTQFGFSLGRTRVNGGNEWWNPDTRAWQSKEFGFSALYDPQTGEWVRNSDLPTGNNLAAGNYFAIAYAGKAVGRTSFRVAPRTAAATNTQGLEAPGNVQPGAVQPDAGPIALVTHDAKQALRVGSPIRVTVRANPGLRGTFDVTPTVQGLPLTESANQPGVYTGTYTVRAGDDVLNGRITAHLVGANGWEDIDQSREPLTIDTSPPRIIGTFPRNGETIDIAQPNITVYADDVGGSGLARATMSITSGGRTVNVPATITPPTAISAVPPQPLSGVVPVKVQVADAAGNVGSATFSFTVQQQGATAIVSITHNATRALQAGEVVTVDMIAAPGGRATFEVLGDNDRLIANNIPMTPIAQGRYRGTYTLQGNEGGQQLRIRGRFTDVNGQTSNAATTTTVSTVAGAQTALTITQPQDQTEIDAPLTVRGQSAPHAIVSVSVRIEGAKPILGGLLGGRPYREDLPTQEVQADANGNWVTPPIELSRPNKVVDLRYVVTAVQTDAAGRRSEPVTVTVVPAE